YTPPAPVPTPAPTPAPAPAPAPNTPAAIRLAIGAVHGRNVTVTVPAAGRATLNATLKHRKVASGSATAKRAGTLTIKLSKTLPKHKKLTLKLTFNHASVTKTF